MYFIRTLHDAGARPTRVRQDGVSRARARDSRPIKDHGMHRSRPGRIIAFFFTQKRVNPGRFTGRQIGASGSILGRQMHSESGLFPYLRDLI